MRIENDEFNSEIFKKRVGRISDVKGEENNDEIEHIVKIALAKDYDFLFIKINTLFQNTVNRLIKNGFNLISTQVTYCLKCGNSNSQNIHLSEGVLFRRLEKKDIPQISNIAKISFSIDQFHVDKDLDDQLCDKYYEQWAINSCNGLADDVFVLDNGEIIGFITVSYQMNNGIVGLAAISPVFRGQGYFNLLIEKTIKELKNKGISMIYYGTQLCNTPVHKTMAKFQAALIESAYVLHIKLNKA